MHGFLIRHLLSIVNLVREQSGSVTETAGFEPRRKNIRGSKPQFIPPV
jgi:hypothetical protein